jgi:hypothetical protein
MLGSSGAGRGQPRLATLLQRLKMSATKLPLIACCRQLGRATGDCPRAVRLPPDRGVYLKMFDEAQLVSALIPARSQVRSKQAGIVRARRHTYRCVCSHALQLGAKRPPGAPPPSQVTLDVYLEAAA